MFERRFSYYQEHILLLQFLEIILRFYFNLAKTWTCSKLILILYVVNLFNCFKFLFIKLNLGCDFFFDEMNH